MKIDIILIATNNYLPLGIRFIKKFIYHYIGNKEIKFYFFSDDDPYKYLSTNEKAMVVPIHLRHKEWTDATNSKFKNIIYLKKKNINSDYIFYFDADANITQNFDERWFIGDLVAGQHFGDRDWMKDEKPYERNPISKAYISQETKLFQMYYLGAFFGGLRDNVNKLSNEIISWQIYDKSMSHEPVFNDESYLNAYFHKNKPIKCILFKDFKFIISDKGGLDNKIEIRDTKIKETIKFLKRSMIKHKEIVYDIQNGQINTEYVSQN